MLLYNRIQQLYFSCVATILDVLATLSRQYHVHELRVWYDVPKGKATEITIWVYAGPLAGTIPYQAVCCIEYNTVVLNRPHGDMRISDE